MSDLPQPPDRPVADPALLPARIPEARVIEPRPTLSLSAPAVAAAGGFLAGFVALVLTRLVRRGGRLLPGAARRRRRAIEVASSRSFLVDVHMLKR